jgi:hypothetical protein
MASRAPNTYVPPPQPSLNGGLYTGEAFKQDALWRNFPATPDAGYMNFVNLRRNGNPPPMAVYHLPGGGLRPGNNTPILPSLWLQQGRVPGMGMLCIPQSDINEKRPLPEQDTFAKYAYLQPAKQWPPCNASM